MVTCNVKKNLRWTGNTDNKKYGRLKLSCISDLILNNRNINVRIKGFGGEGEVIKYLHCKKVYFKLIGFTFQIQT